MVTAEKVIKDGCSFVVVLILLSQLISFASAETQEGSAVLPHNNEAINDQDIVGEIQDEEESEPYLAVLFPWFVQALGIISFFIISRYVTVMPYTAAMFLLGVLMGLGSTRFEQNEDQLTESIQIWELINSEVLLLVFLPGLIFRDAFSLNVHLFQMSFAQCLVFAFPMVLAGTCLVALVAYYIFPYGWTFNLCMTFGSILAATDPVAVSALLNEVGAPPRLKMHISGESLLNDGSAIVFFTIFSNLFLSELEIEGLGEQVDLAQGFLLFFRMSAGGAAIGVAFGIALVATLFFFNRRLNPEENTLQVTATITVAYLCYYVADAVAHTSGVIAVVFCGVVSKALGESFINDKELMENFWVLVEHLLNTLIFALGGVVWGVVVSNIEPRSFVLRDWGYLLVLYVLLSVIRFFLMFAFYPITARIGLKTNVKETLFMSYGGLRGAVGISLAIALDSEVWTATTNLTIRAYTNELFGMVGGIAFLTLFVNGMTAGPLLKKLGLTKLSVVREHLLEKYESHFKEAFLDDFVHLMTHRAFMDVDFALVKHHVPQLGDLTPGLLKKAVLKNKRDQPHYKYRKPNLDNVLPYLIRECGTEEIDLAWVDELNKTEFSDADDEPCHEQAVDEVLHSCDLPELQKSDGHTEETKQLRFTFIEVLKATYAKMIEKGTLDVRTGYGFVPFALNQGLEFAADNAMEGKPLGDWDTSFMNKLPLIASGEHLFHGATKPLQDVVSKHSTRKFSPPPAKNLQQLFQDVNLSHAFIMAHTKSRNYFRQEFCQTAVEVTNSEKIVLKESEEECRKAREFLKTKNKDDVKGVTAHIMCTILLNKAVRYAEKLHKNGLLKDSEATEKIEELDHLLDEVRKCTAHIHPGEMNQVEKSMYNSESAKKGL